MSKIVQNCDPTSQLVMRLMTSDYLQTFKIMSSTLYSTVQISEFV